MRLPPQPHCSASQIPSDMLGTVIDIALGLALLFLIVALVCSAAVEAIANLLKKRAKYLLRGIRELVDVPIAAGSGLNAIKGAARLESALYTEALESRSVAGDSTWTIRLMGHPLVAPLKQARAGGATTRNPSYIPARTFATALLDLIIPDDAGSSSIDKLRTSIEAVPAVDPLRGALLALLKDAGNDVNRFREGIESWYDSQMDRIAGAYKRWAKRWLIVIGLIAASVLNIDALQVGLSLYNDVPLRESAVMAATNGALCPAGGTFAETRQCVTDELVQLGAAGLPVGWSAATIPTEVLGWMGKVLGLALTAAAASLGAPFWFGVLNRVSSVRNAGVKPRSTTS